MKFKNKALYSLLVGSTLLSVSSIKGNNSQRSDDIMSAAEPHKPSQTLQSEITSLRSTDSIFETVVTGKGICLKNRELPLEAGEVIERSIPYTVEKLLFVNASDLPSIGYKPSSPEDATFLAKEITKYQSTSDNVLSVDLTNNTIILKDRPETPLALIAVFNRAQQALKDEALSKDEKELLEEQIREQPIENQPVVPMENTFKFKTERSTSYTPISIQAMDQLFFQQTGGGAWKRNIGTAKMLTLIAKTLKTGKHHLTQEEMDSYASSQILAYLIKIKSPNLNKLMGFLELQIEPEKVDWEGFITPQELYGFVEEQKDSIFPKKGFSKFIAETKRIIKKVFSLF